jgi:hypothetical protein
MEIHQIIDSLNKDEFVNHIMKIVYNLIEIEDLYYDENSINFKHFLHLYLKLDDRKCVRYQENFVRYFKFNIVYPCVFVLRSSKLLLQNYVERIYYEHNKEHKTLQLTDEESYEFWQLLLTQFLNTQFLKVKNGRSLIKMIDTEILHPTSEDTINICRELYTAVNSAIQNDDLRQIVDGNDEYIRHVHQMKTPYFYYMFTQKNHLHQNDILNSFGSPGALSLNILSKHEFVPKYREYKKKHSSFVEFEEKMGTPKYKPKYNQRHIVIMKNDKFNPQTDYISMSIGCDSCGKKSIGCDVCGKKKIGCNSCGMMKKKNDLSPLLTLTDNLSLDPISNQLIGDCVNTSKVYYEYPDGDFNYFIQ